jgi:hypothetical protein
MIEVAATSGFGQLTNYSVQRTAGFSCSTRPVLRIIGEEKRSFATKRLFQDSCMSMSMRVERGRDGMCGLGVL